MAAVVNHVGLCVGDVDRSRRFYEEAFGFVFQRQLSVPDEMASKLLRVPAPVGLTAVYLERPGFVLELLHFAAWPAAAAQERPLTETGLTHLSISVEDLAASCRRVAELGGQVLAETDMDGRAIMVRDPDGQLLELLPMSYRV